MAFLVAFPLPPRQADQAARQVGRLPACTSCPLPTPAADGLSVGAQAGSQTVAAWVRRTGGVLTGTVRALDFHGRAARGAPRIPGARGIGCGPGCVSFALPSAPAVLRKVLAMNSYDISASICSRPGTKARERVAPSMSKAVSSSAISM